MKKSLINFEHGEADAPSDDILFPRFTKLASGYPFALQNGYARILQRIDIAWDSADIDDVLADLIIDKRGGRQGFPLDVLNDIIRLKEFSQSEKLRVKEQRTISLQQLEARGLACCDEDFLRVLLAGDQQALDLYVNAGFRFHHIRDDQQSTPLLIALKKGFTVCANILLQAGEYPNARDQLGLTPLLISCGKTARGYRLITEQLIRSGADIEVRDPLGNTPLLLALSGGVLDIALLLLQQGANPAVVNKVGDSVLSLIEEIPADDDAIVAQILAEVECSKNKDD